MTADRIDHTRTSSKTSSEQAKDTKGQAYRDGRDIERTPLQRGVDPVQEVMNSNPNLSPPIIPNP